MDQEINEGRNKTIYIVIIIAILIGLALMIGRGIYEDGQLDIHHRYAIAITGAKTFGGHVQYEYQVNGILFRSSNKILQLKPNGHRYLLKFNSEDPSLNSEIVSAEEVESCIGEPPADGWAELPTCK